MKFFSRWQPLVDEDAHTALVFGFMRHAPVKAMLEPWLTNLLGRHVTVDEPLAPHDFWPNYRSRMEGRTRTEPELVFAADDGRPLLIVVEVKPSFGQHYVEQIVREAVDTAGERRPARLAVIMVGADLARPAETSGWQGELVTALRRHGHGHGHVEAELRYSSWALLGQRLRSSAVEAPEWRRYADDVVHHLRLKGLLGYNGGPMFDDLEGGLTAVWSYASAEDADRPADDDLARVDRALLECVSVTDYTEWVYADQPWRGGRGEDDVEWALNALGAGSRAWDG